MSVTQGDIAAHGLLQDAAGINRALKRAPAATLAETQSLVSGYPVATRQVSTRSIFPTTLIGGVKQFNSRTGHYMRSGVCTSLRLGYANFYSVYETAPGGAATIEAAIEYPAGTYTRVTWGGSNTCTIADGQMGALSDALTISIPRNAMFWVRTFAQNAAGMVYHGDGIPASNFDSGEFGASGLTSKVMGGSLGPSAAVVRPSLIVGPSDCPAFGYIGDSISEGLGDTFDDLSGDLGIVQRMIGGRYPYVGAGNSGTTCQAFCDNSTKRAAAMSPYITHVVNEYGVNDLSDAGSYQNVLTQLLRVPGIFLGKKIYQCTIVPKSTSTDSWATVANQTAVNSGNRASLNKSITAGLVGYYAAIDTASVCESSPWSGIWRVDLGQPTSDGLHPKTVIYRAVRMSGVFDRIPL